MLDLVTHSGQVSPGAGHTMRKLDSYDKQILARLQVQGDLGAGELSQMIHLSLSQCSRRLQRLKAEGYVQGVVALLSTAHLQIGVMVYVLASLKSHTAECIRAFQERIRSIPEITECHKLTGEADYLLKICTKSLKTYNALLNRHLLLAPEVSRVQSSIVLESLKATTELPMEFL